MPKINRSYVFIDAANVWEVQKSQGRFVDYDKLMLYIKKRFNASEVKAYYYTAYPGEGTRDYDLNGKHKFFKYLSRNLKITVKKKPLKRINTTLAGQAAVREKGNMDVEMTIDAIHHLKNYEAIVFFNRRF